MKYKLKKIKNKIIDISKVLLYDRKNQRISIYKLLFVFMFLITGLSIGYSAFASQLNITGLITEVRLKKDIRITNITVSDVSSSGESKYDEYNKSNISMGVYLPNSDSTVTYKVEITNIGNVEMGILSIDNLPEDLDYELTDYALKTKICNTEGACKLGIKKEFYITIKYKDNVIPETPVVDYTYNLNLDFIFKQAYDITYTGFVKADNFASYLLESEPLRLDLRENEPEQVRLKIGETEISDYVYENGIVTGPNVSDEIELIYEIESAPLNTYITNLYNPNIESLEVNGLKYNLDSKHRLMNDRLGGQETQDSSVGNIRYYGAPIEYEENGTTVSKKLNNYVDIGDSVLWRVIGVFEDVEVVNEDETTESQDLVKIVRDETLGKILWDSNNLANWETATLNTYLNTGEYYTGLSNDVKKKIETVTWYLGGNKNTSLYPDVSYTLERGTIRWDETFPLTWTGQIALVYPSDYMYASNASLCNSLGSQYSPDVVCRDNNWIHMQGHYQWTIMPYTFYNNTVYGISNIGKLGGLEVINVHREARPTLYLKSDIFVTGGTGSDIDPYILEYKERAEYSVTYTNITNNGYKTSIKEGDTLEVDFGENAPSSLKVKINNVETSNYTYENGILTIPNVNGNIEIVKDDSGSTGVQICSLNDANSNNTADVGEMVTCGTGDTAQSFYVMPDHENAGANTVSMLAEHIITITETNPVQSDSYAGTAFSSSNYWGSVSDGTFIYNDSASVSTYVNAYKETLKGIGLSDNIIVTLPSLQQFTDSSVGCALSGEFYQCEAAPSWIYSTDFWLGNLRTSGDIYSMAAGECDLGECYAGIIGRSNYKLLRGVRPIVIIPESEIGI